MMPSNTNYKKKSRIQYFVGAAWPTQASRRDKNSEIVGAASRRDKNSENYVVFSKKWYNDSFPGNPGFPSSGKTLNGTHSWKYGGTKRALFCIVFALMMFLFPAGISPLDAAPQKQDKLGRYVLRLYKRILAIGSFVLKMEQGIIYRLEKKREVDFSRYLPRYLSAKQQIQRSFRIARFLSKRVPASSPSFPQIQAAKSKIPYILEGHVKNAKRIKELGGDLIKKATEELVEACSEVDLEEETLYPVTQIDDYF